MKNSRIAKAFHSMTQAWYEGLLPLAWRRESSIPGVDHHDQWTEKNPALGHSAVTALYIQAKLGGEILVAEVDTHRHFWNRLRDGREYDFTRCQYPAGTSVGPGTPIDRHDLLGSDRAHRTYLQDRYHYFRDRCDAAVRMLKKYKQESLLAPDAPARSLKGDPT